MFSSGIAGLPTTRPVSINSLMVWYGRIPSFRPSGNSPAGSGNKPGSLFFNSALDMVSEYSCVSEMALLGGFTGLESDFNLRAHKGRCQATAGQGMQTGKAIYTRARFSRAGGVAQFSIRMTA